MRRSILFSLFCLVGLTLAGCGIINLESPTPVPSVEVDEKELTQYVEIRFTTHVPANTDEDQKVYLQVLDEVTGLLINAVTYEMDRVDANLYKANIPVPLNSVVKYRYTLGDSQTNVEFTPNGEPVRYRMVSATNSQEIEDTVGTWTGEFTGNYGRIMGTVLDENGNPVADSLILVGGSQTITSNEGTFVIDGVPIGKNTLVVYSMIGAHHVFQQEVYVATDSATPVDVNVFASQYVDVTFHLTVPDDSFTKLPIRLLGNLYQTGNVFTDLVGGISVPASRALYLNYLGGSQHEIVLRLPVGTDFQYKYSHGDGFWSAEQSSDERFPVRRLIVPDTDVDIYDTIESWSISEKAPVSFIVETPENMPAGSTVSIQLRPYDWMTPIPMWQIDDTHWFFALSSPLDYFDNLNYRYCLNGNCDQTPEVNLDGLMIQRKVALDTVPVNVEDEIWGWRWFEQVKEDSEPFSVSASSKSNEYIFGFEVDAREVSDDQNAMYQGIKNSDDLGSGMLIFSPEWVFTRINIPNISPAVVTASLDYDLEQQLSWVSQFGSSSGLFPATDLGRFEDYFWDYAQQDFGWWSSYFERYQTFLMHYALLAEDQGSSLLIVGEPHLQDAMLQYKNKDFMGKTGTEFDTFLSEMLQQVDEQFSGRILWAVDYDGSEESLAISEAVESSVDGYYVMWQVEESSELEFNTANFAPLFMEKLESIKPLSEDNKFVVLSFEYPAITGAETGTVSQSETLIDLEDIEDYSVFMVDEKTQAQLYSIAFNAVESQDWVGGFISRGYDLGNTAPDPSPSIRGKEAEKLFQLWFEQWQPAE